MYSPFHSKKHWPAAYMPEDVFHHFLITVYYAQKRKYVYLYGREGFLNALNSNEEFATFWTYIQEQHPEKKDYFSSLFNEHEPYDSCWINFEYDEYQKQTAFEALSEEQRRTLQNEFDEFKVSAYRAALEGESVRLKCDITEVKPSSPVLHWKPDHDEESMLARLPAELLGRVLPLLDTLDIFKMSLVCKRWKNIVYEKCTEVKRAEHSMTTHLITFTDWMHSAKTQRNDVFLYQYQLYSWSLTRWFCGVAKNLEILILDHPVSYFDLADLLQSCPDLKHLRIGYCYNQYAFSHHQIPARVHLPKLEMFVSFCSPFRLGRNNSCRRLHRDILVSSPSLRVFRGPLNIEDLTAIDAQIPVSNVFNKLIALELENFTTTSLEFLASIDGLQVRYLRLGTHVRDFEVSEIHDNTQSRIAFHQLLPKLKKLEMLRTSRHIGVTNETIQLLTNLRLSLRWAVLCQAYVPTDHDDEEEDVVAPIEIDPLQPKVLDAFQRMLLSRNPDIDLSEIRLVFREEGTFEALKAMNTGFSILETNLAGYRALPVNELYDPIVKRRLGVDF